MDSENEVHTTVNKWLQCQSADIYAEEIQKIVHQWQKCVALSRSKSSMPLNYILSYNKIFFTC